VSTKQIHEVYSVEIWQIQIQVLYSKSADNIADMESMLNSSSQTLSFYGDLSLKQDFLFKYFGLQQGLHHGLQYGGTGGLAETVSAWSLPDRRENFTPREKLTLP
jgi:hypothetical protein